MDMLRFHKFTIGHAWTSEFGCSDKEEEFHWLIKWASYIFHWIWLIKFTKIDLNLLRPNSPVCLLLLLSVWWSGTRRCITLEGRGINLSLVMVRTSLSIHQPCCWQPTTMTVLCHCTRSSYWRYVPKLILYIKHSRLVHHFNFSNSAFICLVIIIDHAPCSMRELGDQSSNESHPRTHRM